MCIYREKEIYVHLSCKIKTRWSLKKKNIHFRKAILSQHT